MTGSNRDRMRFLRDRVNSLASLIDSSGLGDRYLEYVNQVAKGQHQPEAVDEVEWDTLLAAEKKNRLFAHYHTMRSELLEMMRLADQPSTLERINVWLESPWMKTAVTVGTLTHAAMLLAQILQHSGLFLSDVDAEGKRNVPS